MKFMWDIIGMLKTFFGATESVADAVKQRDGELNAPEIKDNAASATEQQIKADAEKAVAAQDLDKLRKDLAE